MEKNSDNFIPRPAIVVIMGHIDHGKTTLLDYIRKTKVAERETGGITQHVGAYEIKYQDKKIVFIDTPGHEAFSKMRSRGARIADLAILVVAGDDGVKPQTIEALGAIKEAEIPFIVAINKIDKEGANPERVKKELAEAEIYVEGFGGNVPAVNISAKTGQGIPELLEMIILVSEMEELKADPSCLASGVVIESHLDPKRGITATLIIENGTLKKKMFINAGGAIAGVKIFEDFLGRTIEEATFSSPVKIVGFDKLPGAGANFKAYGSKAEAESAKENLSQACPTAGKFKKIPEEKFLVPLIIKADVSGSLEALEKEILKLENQDVTFNIVRLNVGNITENDIKLASADKNTIVIGFRVKTEAGAEQTAERLGVKIALFDIIYKMSEWLEEEIKKMAPQKEIEETIGTAELIKVFKQEKNKQIIGALVLSGRVAAGKYVKISRRGAIIARGKILELQQGRMPVSEVEQGKEFGALVDIKTELAKKDIIEVYDISAPGKI